MLELLLNKHGLASLIGIIIVALIGVLLFIFILRGNAVQDDGEEARIQNPDVYQQQVDEAITKAAENNEELYDSMTDW